MAIESKSVDIGFPCPDFSLPSALGSTVARDNFRDAPVFGVFFTCNHCPYAKAIEGRLLELDDSPMDASKVKRRELREALDALLAGKTPDPKQNPSIGCSIKWK